MGMMEMNVPNQQAQYGGGGGYLNNGFDNQNGFDQNQPNYGQDDTYQQTNEDFKANF
jgi:hypothetical protein